jgi:GNAT superfamily N-acetyltransferase
MDTQIEILHKHRLEAFDEKKSWSGALRFEKVKIKFSDGTLFYDGWVQDLGLNSGPTVFDTNYHNHGLEYEDTFELDKYYELEEPHGEYTIRAATPEDLEQIIDLRFHNYFDDYYHRISAFQALNHQFGDDYFTWVVEIGGMLVGHAYYRMDQEYSFERDQEETTAYLDDFFVHQAFRGNGLGAALFHASEEALKKVGAETIGLKIIGDPDQCEDAARFYDRQGFTVKQCYENPEGVCNAEMEKLLSISNGSSEVTR